MFNGVRSPVPNSMTYTGHTTRGRRLRRVARTEPSSRDVFCVARIGSMVMPVCEEG
jgi:hypothetical protein